MTAAGVVARPKDVRANTTRAGDHSSPPIVIDATDALYVVWQDSRSGTPRIYVHKFDTNGNALWASDTPGSVDSSGSQQLPAAVLLTNGDLYVVWQDNRNGTNDSYLQLVDSSGATVWPEDIRVNSLTNGDQSEPAIVINQNGNPVVVWQDNQTSTYDIRAVEYGGDPSGTSPIGNVPLTITGTKQVGNSPVIYKYRANLSTNGSGVLVLPAMEWDTYSISLQGGSGYTFYGAEPQLPIAFAPAEVVTITLRLE